MENENKMEIQKKTISKSRIEDLERKEKELEQFRKQKEAIGEDLIIEPIEAPVQEEKTQNKEVFKCLKCGSEVEAMQESCNECKAVLVWSED